MYIYGSLHSARVGVGKEGSMLCWGISNYCLEHVIPCRYGNHGGCEHAHWCHLMCHMCITWHCHMICPLTHSALHLSLSLFVHVVFLPIKLYSFSVLFVIMQHWYIQVHTLDTIILGPLSPMLAQTIIQKVHTISICPVIFQSFVVFI